MAATSDASFESFGDFEKVAQFFTDYNTSWSVVYDIIAPIHSEMLLFYWKYVLIVILGVLTYHISRMDFERLAKFFVALFFVSIFLTGTSVSTTGAWSRPSNSALKNLEASAKTQTTGNSVKVAASIHYFNEITDAALDLLIAAVDKGIGRQGPAGDFRSPMGALASLNKAYVDLLNDSNLKTAYHDYLRSCSHLAPKMAGSDATSVGLLGGTLGNTSFFGKGASQSAVNVLRSYYLNNGAYNRPEGYYLEASEYWTDRLGRKQSERDRKPVAAMLASDKQLGGQLQYQPSSEIPEGKKEEYRYRFYARTCGDLYEIANLGMIQYDEALKVHYKGFTKNANTNPGGLDSLPGGKAALASAAGQYYLYQIMNADTADRTGAAASWSAEAAGVAKGATGGALSWFYTFWEGIKFEYFAVLFPAIGASATALIFMMFPIAAALTLIPGRGSLLPNLFYALVFVKMTIFFAYLITKFGGIMSTAAIEVMVNSSARGGTNLAASIIPWAIGGQVLTMLAAICGAPMAAYMLVFNESAGLKSVKFDRFGAQSLVHAGAAAMGGMAAIKRLSTKGGGTPGGVGNLTINAQSGSNVNVASVNPRASAGGAQRRSTLNGVASRVSEPNEDKPQN